MAKIPEIYLSLTTMPERIKSKHFYRVYQSLLHQNIPFTKLIINLQINVFTYFIPNYLLNNRVILNPTTIKGPCAKLLGSIDIIPKNSLVIVLDDDIIMRSHFIGVLYRSYLKNPDKVTSNSTSLSLNKKYNEVQGFAGYIFNIEKLRQIKYFYKTMPRFCIKIDDNWISWCINKLGVSVVKSLEKNPWNVINIEVTTTHPQWYELTKDTNRKQLIQRMHRILK